MRMALDPSSPLQEALARSRALEAFKAGFTHYVGPVVPEQPNTYWNPRLGQWVTLSPADWEVTDKGLPQTGIDYPADHFFNELTEQWNAMSATDHAIAYWSPSRKRWLIATLRSATGPDKGDGPGSAQQEQEQWLLHLHELYVKGVITYPVYQRAVADALAGRPPTI
jgi:hypothetical protein